MEISSVFDAYVAQLGGAPWLLLAFVLLVAVLNLPRRRRRR
jgi:hypothetical protein